MASADQHIDYGRTVRRTLVTLSVLAMVALIAVWRIDNPRVERMRMKVIDRVVPSFDWALAPVTGASRFLADVTAFSRVYEQNRELRRELQEMKGWKEAAIQLEQQNARLRGMNNVKLSPRVTYIVGTVTTDSGSPFRKSALLNIGEKDGVLDGWAATDELGLVGRLAGVGEQTSRVLLVTDSTSRVPAVIRPSGTLALVSGDNTGVPVLDFIDTDVDVEPNDRVVTTGDGGVFPPDLLIGQVARAPDGRYRVRLAADLRRLEFLRVLRHAPGTEIAEPDELIDFQERPAPDAEMEEAG